MDWPRLIVDHCLAIHCLFHQLTVASDSGNLGNYYQTVAIQIAWPTLRALRVPDQSQGLDRH
jgi:hypothetical protein